MINWSGKVSETRAGYKTWRYALGRPTREECADDQDHKFRSMEWAEILIDSNGMFAAVSDYGEFIYRWGYFNGDFRYQILRFSDDYFLGKTRGNKQEVKVEKTVEYIKKHIIEYRRTEYSRWSKNRARREWELIKDCETEEDIDNWLNATEIQDAWEMVHYDYDEMAYRFCREILPRLRARIRKQLRDEEQEARTARHLACRAMRQGIRVTTPVC